MNTVHNHNTFKNNFFRITLNYSFNLLLFYQLYYIKVKNSYMYRWKRKNYFKFLKLKNWVKAIMKLNFFFLNIWFIKKLINCNLLTWCLIKFSKKKKKFKFKKNLFKFGYKWKYKFKFKRLKSKKIIKLKIIKLWFFLNNRLNINNNSKKKFWLIWLKKKYNNVYLKRIKLIKKIKKKWIYKKKKNLTKYKKSKLKISSLKKKWRKKKKKSKKKNKLKLFFRLYNPLLLKLKNIFLKKSNHLDANILKKKKINYNIHNINFFKKKYKFIKFNKFNFFLNYRYNLIFKKKKLKKELFLFFFNFFFKINFEIINIKVILKLNITLKKLQLIKDNYRVVLKNSKFKKWNFLDKRYFLSFLYIIWYKNIFFLTYFVWNSFNKLKNKEKRILKTTFLFLNSFPLAKIGIIGFKLLIKGKLFKRPRKKKKLIKKGRVPLLNPLYYIVYNKYLIITRAGLFSFHIWVTFFK